MSNDSVCAFPLPDQDPKRRQATVAGLTSEECTGFAPEPQAKDSNAEATTIAFEQRGM